MFFFCVNWTNSIIIQKDYSELHVPPWVGNLNKMTLKLRLCSTSYPRTSDKSYNSVQKCKKLTHLRPAVAEEEFTDSVHMHNFTEITE